MHGPGGPPSSDARVATSKRRAVGRGSPSIEGAQSAIGRVRRKPATSRTRPAVGPTPILNAWLRSRTQRLARSSTERSCVLGGSGKASPGRRWLPSWALAQARSSAGKPGALSHEGRVCSSFSGFRRPPQGHAAGRAATPLRQEAELPKHGSRRSMPQARRSPPTSPLRTASPRKTFSIWPAGLPEHSLTKVRHSQARSSLASSTCGTCNRLASAPNLQEIGMAEAQQAAWARNLAAPWQPPRFRCVDRNTAPSAPRLRLRAQ